MGISVKQPTANETPDATLGGNAVTTVSNTGHAETTTTASGAGGTAEKSCRWSTFQSAGGTITAITLKVTHTSSGTLTGGSSNMFTLDYTLNGGSSWTNAVTRSSFTAAQGPTTFSVALSVAQDISQVQVRVDYLCDSNEAGDSASVVATISNIMLEVATLERQRVIVMM